MRRNEDTVNGAVPFHRARHGRVARAAAAVALTLLALVLHSPVALADGGGFDDSGGSGGGDIDEQESNWWDGLPNIMEMIQTTLFPSYTYGGGGGGHSFGDWRDGESSSSSSSDTGQAVDTSGWLVFSGNVAYVSANVTTVIKGNDGTLYTNSTRNSDATLLPASMNVVVDKEFFSDIPEGTQYAIEIDPSNTSGRIGVQVVQISSSATSKNSVVNESDYVSSLTLTGLSNQFNCDPKGYSTSGDYYEFDGHTLHIARRSSTTRAFRAYDGTRSRGTDVQLFINGAYQGGGGDNPSGGNDNPSGGGGIDVHFGGDTYNHETNNYNNYTYVGENNVDLTPITKRQDVLIENTSQLGRDLESLAVVIDYDLMQVYYAVLSQAALQKRGNDYLASMESDLELVVQALNNLQDDNGLGTVRGYLKMIYDELAAWPEYPQPTQVSIPDPVTTDLSAVESKLDEVIRLLRSGEHTNPTIPHDDNNDIGVEIGDKMQQVAQRFPFSVPWDVMHILGLLRSERLAPQFDLPVIGSEESIHVDLSGWEPVAVVTRSGTFVLFALGLALRSKALITSWSGGNA